MNKENRDLLCYNVIETGEQWHPLPWPVRCRGGCPGDNHDSEVTVWDWRTFILITKKRTLSGIQAKDKPNYTTLGETEIFTFWLFWSVLGSHASPQPVLCHGADPHAWCSALFVILKSVVVLSTIKTKSRLLEHCTMRVFGFHFSYVHEKRYPVWRTLAIEDARNKWVIFQWTRLYVGSFIGWFSQSEFAINHMSELLIHLHINWLILSSMPLWVF